MRITLLNIVFFLLISISLYSQAKQVKRPEDDELEDAKVYEPIVEVAEPYQKDSIDPQDSTDYAQLSPKLSLYLEMYYGNDFNVTKGHDREGFFYNFKRNKELSLNIALLKASGSNSKLRYNVAIMAGDYPRFNLAHEPVELRFLNEANAGIYLGSQYDFWLDVGVFPGHMGFESAIEKDCWSLTRSIIAENIPYYETGLKLTGTSLNEQFTYSGFLLNGWQRMTLPTEIPFPAYGAQITYNPSDKWYVNISGFQGIISQDSTLTIQKKRTYIDFFVVFKPNDKCSILLGASSGADYQNYFNYNEMKENNIWGASLFSWKQILTKKKSITLRGEYFNDGYKTVISLSDNLSVFKVGGGSINYDYAINKYGNFRAEIRALYSTEKIFTSDGKYKSWNVFSTFSVQIGI